MRLTMELRMRFSIIRVAALAALPVLAFGQKKEVQELQRDVALLQDQVRTLQRSIDERMAALNVLVQQTLDSINKVNTAVAVLESGFRDRMREQEKTVVTPVAGLGAKVDAMAEEFRFVKESIADMNSRMGKLQAQIVDLGNAVKVMQSPPPPPSGAAGPPAGVSAESLYQSALRDRSAGNIDLALQEFRDYLRYFPTTDLAPNAQFYVGMIHYDRGEIEAAIAAFDAVLEKFPENSKTVDAMYMKGMALLKNNQRTAAAQEFREVIKRSPRSDMAEKSRERLKAMGLSTTATPARSTKKKR